MLFSAGIENQKVLPYSPLDSFGLTRGIKAAIGYQRNEEKYFTSVNEEARKIIDKDSRYNKRNEILDGIE